MLLAGKYMAFYLDESTTNGTWWTWVLSTKQRGSQCWRAQGLLLLLNVRVRM